MLIGVHHLSHSTQTLKQWSIGTVPSESLRGSFQDTVGYPQRNSYSALSFILTLLCSLHNIVSPPPPPLIAEPVRYSSENTQLYIGWLYLVHLYGFTKLYCCIYYPICTLFVSNVLGTWELELTIYHVPYILL